MPIFPLYASSDAAGFDRGGYQVGQGAGFSLEEVVYVETIDEKPTPVSAGQYLLRNDGYQSGLIVTVDASGRVVAHGERLTLRW